MLELAPGHSGVALGGTNDTRGSELSIADGVIFTELH